MRLIGGLESILDSIRDHIGSILSSISDPKALPSFTMVKSPRRRVVRAEFLGGGRVIGTLLLSCPPAEIRRHVCI